jgi:hypothetical protein
MIAPETGVRSSRFALSVTPRDGMPWLTMLTVAGLASAVVLALIGGFPVDMPMPEHAAGWVAPTCGLTRGSTAIARGDWALAWRYNPASFVIMGLGGLGVVRWLAGSVLHRWVEVRWRPGKLAAVVAAATLVAWTLYQQTNAEFIITSRA